MKISVRNSIGSEVYYEDMYPNDPSVDTAAFLYSRIVVYVKNGCKVIFDDISFDGDTVYFPEL